MQKFLDIVVKYNKPLKQISFVLGAILAAVAAYTDYMEKSMNAKEEIPAIDGE